MINYDSPRDSPEAREFGRRREQLARFLRLSAQFTQIVGCWAGFGLQGEQTARSTAVGLGEDNARLLDLPIGATVLRRDIHLLPIVDGPMFLAASLTELVHEPRLGLDLAGRRALRDGADPLDQVVAPLSRTVCYLDRSSGRPTPDDIALRATTLLVGAGRPIAVVHESVYWQLITHRTPDVLPDHGRLPAPARPDSGMNCPLTGRTTTARPTGRSTERSSAGDASTHLGATTRGGDPVSATSTTA